MEYGCIGEKLSHSFSALIHNKLCGYSYELLELTPGQVPEFMKTAAFKAINVTIPYKQTVIPFLDEISPTASLVGAVNTVVNQNGRLVGFNTDFSGMEALITRSGMDLSGKKVLILGSGGTSLTANAVAKHLGADQILRVSRSGGEGLITYEQAAGRHRDAQVIINTTPCGMYPNIKTKAVEVADFPALTALVDAVYNPLRSRLVSDARKRGIVATGGLYMLVAQAAFAAEKFTGNPIGQEQISRVFREVLDSKKNLVLTGMPSCGKSTVGKILAERLNKRFLDTDAEISCKTGKTIPEIFADSGEAGFRKIESEVIAAVSAQQGAVIATGGGVVLNPENTELLRLNGDIFFLDRPIDKLFYTADRPLSSNREDLEALYRQRKDVYLSSADFRIVSDTAAQSAAEKIMEKYYENLGY